MKSGHPSHRFLLCALTALGPACSGRIFGGGDDADDGGEEPLVCAPETASSLPDQLNRPAWRFQVIGDVHAHRSDPRSFTNIVRALEELRGIGPDAAALVINGDLTERGYSDDYAYLTSAMSGGSAPRLYNLGNHEYHGTGSSSTERQRFLSYAGLSTVYYERTINDHPFLFIAGENGDAESWPSGSQYAWYAVLSDAQLDWLDERLTAVASATRPTFVFLHQHPNNSTQPDRLKQILRAHPNVVLFFSHWHQDLHSGSGSHYSAADGFLLVHTGSVQYTKVDGVLHYDWKQGLQITVYPDRLRIQGRDFNTRAWISQFERAHDLRAASLLGSVGVNEDGRLDVILVGTDGASTHSVQSSPGDGWSEWSGQGGTAASAPVVVRNADGRLEAFARGADGALQHSVQESPGGAWSVWSSLGGALSSNVAVGINADGRLEAFALGLNRALYHTLQETPGGDTWSDWQSLGGTLTTDPAVARTSDGRLMVFARGASSTLYHIWQTPEGSWSAWTNLGGVLTSDFAVGTNADGRLEVFARGTTNALFHIGQEPDGSWSDWAGMGGAFASSPVVVSNLDGRLEVFATASDGTLHRARQAAASSADWSEWIDMGGAFDSDPVVAVNLDGRVEVFARGTDGELHHNRQQTAGECWTGWSATGIEVNVF